MNNTELQASELLLDLGVSIPLRPLRFLSRKLQVSRATLRRPYMGTIIAQSRYYNRIGVTGEELKGYTQEQWMSFIAEHGKDASKIAACCICRGFIMYHLFHLMVAWWLRWRVHPAVLGEVMMIAIGNINTGPFQITIRSVEMINLLKPRLSR